MAGSNNFKVFDETATNIMADVAYAASTARTNGVQNGVADATLHNKLFRQASIMAYAIGEVIKANGLAASDADISALVAVLNGLLVTNINTMELTNKTLTSPLIKAALLDQNGNEIIRMVPVAGAVNDITITNADATGHHPSISASGDEANISLKLVPKGSGSIQCGTNLVNFLYLAGNNTAAYPTIAATGSDASVGLNIAVKGGAPIQFPVGRANLFAAYGADAGGNPTLAAGGTDNDVSFVLNAKGSGGVYFNTFKTNYAGIRGAATTFPPYLAVEGGDANIGFDIVTKGTGVVRANGAALAGAGTGLSASTGAVTVPMDGVIKSLIPTGACTLSPSGGGTGQRVTIEIITAGTTSFNITFGGTFRSQGVLATGAVSGKVFMVSFIYEGSTWMETGRTVAI